jgi:Uncharacterised methyltransferase family (DUF6094)
MRLAGRAKAGFYPTPLTVLERIIGALKSGPRPLRILDPCCGLGDPLKRIAEHTGAESYGIELDRHRATEAREKLSHILNSDALTARVSPSAFSLLFLNPPYDQDETGRLEYRFLVKSTPWLIPRGLLIYVIPQGRYLKNTLRYLASWFENVRIFRFPEEEFWRFKQTVLFAVKKPRAVLDPNLMDQMNACLQGNLSELPNQGLPVYLLPSVPTNDGFIFRPGDVNPEEAMPEIKVHGVWQIPEVKENIEPQESKQAVQPLMPLRQGHLAQLIAAGFINNQVIIKDGKRLLIKGQTIKSTIRLPTEDEDTTIERDVIRTTIMALDEKGRVIEIGEEG